MANILFVDDSHSMRTLVSSCLVDAGHSVKVAVDGQDGLQVASSSQYELIITDINMPKMNGIELIKELRKLSQYKFTPILILTTESSADKKSEGKQAGATGWIVKPFNPEKLLQAIGKVCR